MSTDMLLGGLALALAWDLLFGELPNALHPVAWIGRVIGTWKRRAPRRGARALLLGGLFALGFPLALALGVRETQLQLAAWPSLGGLVGLFMLQATFAWRGLFQAGARVGSALRAGDLASARHRIGALCSRDGSNLSASEVERAAVESLAENSSDSFVAPLFWLGLLGLPGAVFYRAVNTADAMLGYRGELELAGKAAARLDDLCNLIPARLTGIAIVLASAILRLDAPRALCVLARDRGKTDSPNAGWPMAAAAGGLGVVLEKRGDYALGKGFVEDAQHAPAELLDRGVRLTQLASLLGGAASLGLGLYLRTSLLPWLPLGGGLHAPV